MKRTILNQEDYFTFYKTLIFNNYDDPILTSVKSAYRDVCRTISGFSKNIHRDEIYNKCCIELKKQIIEIKKVNVLTQEKFDKWHQECCNKLITIFYPQKFYYGQAQKWINMSLKNLSILNHQDVESFYEYCHIPIDNFILTKTGYNKLLNTAWSRIDKYETYLNLQKKFREEYSGIPLDTEFKMWLEVRKG